MDIGAHGSGFRYNQGLGLRVYALGFVEGSQLGGGSFRYNLGLGLRVYALGFVEGSQLGGENRSKLRAFISPLGFRI